MGQIIINKCEANTYGSICRRLWNSSGGNCRSTVYISHSHYLLHEARNRDSSLDMLQTANNTLPSQINDINSQHLVHNTQIDWDSPWLLWCVLPTCVNRHYNNPNWFWTTRVCRPGAHEVAQPTVPSRWKRPPKYQTTRGGVVLY